MQRGTCLQVLGPCLHMLVLCGMNNITVMVVNIDITKFKELKIEVTMATSSK